MKRILGILLLTSGAAVAADDDGYVPVSGYDLMEPATQQLQDDDFLNPAFFFVDKGLALWNQEWATGSPEGMSCRSCHDDPAPSMRGVAARYPTYDESTASFVNLEMKINSEIVTRFGGEALEYESEDLLALTMLIAFQSRTMPMAIRVDENSQPWIEWGQEIYETKRGQLNLSCGDCHRDHWGEKLRGDVISQGQINAFPLFRLTWGEVGSRHRIFSWCMKSIRSEPYQYGSDEYLALEAYLAVRGEGLLIEAPGVRR